MAIAQGKVKTQASARLRKVNTCTPESLAAIGPRRPKKTLGSGRDRAAKAIRCRDLSRCDDFGRSRNNPEDAITGEEEPES